MRQQKDAQPVRDHPGNAIVFLAAVASPIGIPGIGVPAGLGALRGREHPIKLRSIAARPGRSANRDVVAMRVLG